MYVRTMYVCMYAQTDGRFRNRGNFRTDARKDGGCESAPAKTRRRFGAEEASKALGATRYNLSYSRKTHGRRSSCARDGYYSRIGPTDLVRSSNVSAANLVRIFHSRRSFRERLNLSYVSSTMMVVNETRGKGQRLHVDEIEK